MKFAATAIAILAIAIAIPSSSANTQPGFIEKLTSTPFQFSQRWSNWIHKPMKGCDKKSIQNAINSDYQGTGKPMLEANSYFGQLAGYLAEEHSCAITEMEAERVAFNAADKKVLEQVMVEIATINDRLKAKNLDDEKTIALISDREHLMALVPYGLDAGAQEFMTDMTARPSRGQSAQKRGHNFLNGLTNYAKTSLQRMKSDQERWAEGAERSRAAVASGDTDFVGRHFDSHLRQIAQDQNLFSSLDTTLQMKSHTDHEIGRCLIAARFGDSRKTVSAYIDGALLLGSVIPFAGWGIAITRGYRAAEAAAALIERGGRLATASARLRQRYLVLAAEKAAAGKLYSRVGATMLTAGVAKTGRDCYASCYENILDGVVRSVEGQLDCKKITRLKGDFKDCAVQCARAVGRAVPIIRVVAPVVPDKTIKGAVESVQ